MGGNRIIKGDGKREKEKLEVGGGGISKVRDCAFLFYVNSI